MKNDLQRLILLVSSYVFCACSTKNESAIFTQGNQYLQHADYKNALKLYQSLIRKGVARSELYCNTGNGYLKTGHAGLAVLYYEKGLVRSPGNHDILLNKQVALHELAQSRINQENTLTDFDGRLFQVCDVVVIITMCVLFVGGMMGLLDSLLRHYPKQAQVRTGTKLIWVFSGPLFILSSGLLLSRHLSPEAIVLEDLPGKNGPSGTAKSISYLKLGERVEVQNEFQGWKKIRRINGEESWIIASQVVSINN